MAERTLRVLFWSAVGAKLPLGRWMRSRHHGQWREMSVLNGVSAYTVKTIHPCERGSRPADGFEPQRLACNIRNDPPFLPSSSLERDFCRRRRTRKKRPEDDISEQRPEFGDYRARFAPVVTNRSFFCLFGSTVPTGVVFASAIAPGSSAA